MKDLKDKILKCNSVIIDCYLSGDIKQMDLCRILLNFYIDEAIKYKNNETTISRAS